jgi:hypothetical protein
MKKKMKGFCLMLFAVMTLVAGSAQTVSVTGGRTMIPALYAGVGYSHPTNSAINLGGRLFVERAQFSRIDYSAAGADLMLEYLNSRPPEETKCAFRFAAGATAQAETEPWIYKTLSFTQRLNYGVLTELSGVWNITEAFALSVFGQQKFLFNKVLGATHFLFGLTLSCRPGL